MILTTLQNYLFTLDVFRYDTCCVVRDVLFHRIEHSSCRASVCMEEKNGPDRWKKYLKTD